MDGQKNITEVTMRMEQGPGEDYFDPVAPPANHGIEPDFDFSQFNFTAETASALVTALDAYNTPCCVCTPTLAFEWRNRGRQVVLLDIDLRYANCGEFRRFDLRHPSRLDSAFDVLIVDPPFFLATQLHHALCILVGDRRPDLFLVFDATHESELFATFDD